MIDKEKTKRREAFMTEAKLKYEQSIVDWKKLYDSKKDCEFLDEDGYPTDDALNLIENWHFSDAKGFFDFVKSIWWSSDWGWSVVIGGKDWFTDIELKPETVRFHISTGGWSGNESIIKAMEKNEMMWFMNWVQSRRGGHYIFELKEYGKTETD